LTVDDANYLREALLAAARDNDACSTEHDEFGRRYVIDLIAGGPAGQASVSKSHCQQSRIAAKCPLSQS